MVFCLPQILFSFLLIFSAKTFKELLTRICCSADCSITNQKRPFLYIRKRPVREMNVCSAARKSHVALQATVTAIRLRQQKSYCFIYTKSSNPHNYPRRKVLLLFPFYRWGNWGSERLSILSVSPTPGLSDSTARVLNYPEVFPIWPQKKILYSFLDFLFKQYSSEPCHLL